MAGNREGFFLQAIEDKARQKIESVTLFYSEPVGVREDISARIAQ